MKSIIMICGLLMSCAFVCPVYAQIDSEVFEEVPTSKPLDGIYEKKIHKEKRTLEFEHVREADVFWEKRVWRVLDVREKMNKSFVYPKAPFVNIMLDAAKNKEISVYSTMDDEFGHRLNEADLMALISNTDTIMVTDPVTYDTELKIVHNPLNWEDIKRFRIKEVWYFDEETSTMKTRILGIAPLQEVYDDNDNFRYEKPLFWVYYPEFRQTLANNLAFNQMVTGNDASPITWEDVFEMRAFSSYIFKESNVYDRRIQDHKNGIDILLEAKKINSEIFNFEHDLWSM